MKTADIRAAYLEFFEARDHKVVSSSSLVPVKDPTLLFTNAGMVQFKDALTGRENLGFSRAVSCQRCVRAGGKHNDLENVGYTARHQTLFEMLGNFSFGDYFKEDAISWAWEFVTEVLNFPKDRLWVTVHPTDKEARKLWVEKIGIPSDRVIDHEENFWAMGETGPCGPDSEIFFDQGPDIVGGPPGTTGEDGDRFLEFWNLVFPQFDRAPDGELMPLKNPGVDTGMGLERIAALSQGVSSNYETDGFRRLIREAGRLAGFGNIGEILENTSLRVIADHIRAATFLIADGVTPGNGERDYVLRRIIRRGLRHGYMLDINAPFFHRLVLPLVEELGEIYPRITEDSERISNVLLGEEERFARTLERGMQLLEKTITGLDGDTIPGDVIFELYDTFGFPVDLTADVARERGLEMDTEGYEAAMNEQRARSQGASRFDLGDEQRVQVESNVRFEGYSTLRIDANVVALFETTSRGPVGLKALEKGQSGLVVLDQTPFYAEAGGQVGDSGEIRAEGGVFKVLDTTRGGGQYLHRGEVIEGSIIVGQTVGARVDPDQRRDVAINHSATHLLHAALRDVLGDHVTQKGSLVAADRFRFDFSHPDPLARTQLAEIERLVNQKIRENSAVTTETLSFQEAIDKGAMALFGEKYGEEVRVLTMGGGYSVELCGGTHARRTGDIGFMRILQESGIAAGVRRIEAVTGNGAVRFIEDGENLIEDIAHIVRGGRDELVDKVQSLWDQTKSVQKELDAIKNQLAQTQSSDLINAAVLVGDVKVLGARIDGDQKTLLRTLDGLKDKLVTAVIVLAEVSDGRVSLIAGVTKNLTDRIKAGDVVNFVAAQIGAKGGGREDMARAGGGDKPEQLSAAFTSLPDWVGERISD